MLEYLPAMIEELAPAAEQDADLHWWLEGARRQLARYNPDA
ncbi:MAG: hypothetical protein AAGC55_04045 [Myxococcota bacterium]